MIRPIFATFSTLLFATISLQADYYYSGGKRHELIKQKNNRDTKADILTYKSENNTTIKINKNIIICFSDTKVKKDIENNYHLTFIKKLSYNMYLYRVAKSEQTLQSANSIYEEAGVKFAHPDFEIKKDSRAITHDPYSYDSWYLKDEALHNGSDLNIEQAWQYTKGAGVKIAIYDKGIDIDHPDLRENIYAFKNYNDPISNIPYSNDDKNWHGTACTGIIAARQNNIGSVGIAPESSIYAIGYSETNTSKDIEAYNWMMEEGVSVINNSWGSYTNLDAYNEIFKTLATQGRDGKGILLIFAAGNKGENLDELTSAGKEINDESESEYVLSISASTRRNVIASYANYGSAVDFTAPGGDSDFGIYTTDARGSLGYTKYDYNPNFMGTSAAAPMVSGTIGLMLAANPELRREDVIKILKFTARKQGQYTYDENGFNIHWGYGKIDAGKAVALAYTYGSSKLKNFARTMYTQLK